eukprot:COSAG02_NODE_31324_length_535_cov_1.344037_1_plen_178_part_11
MTVIVFIFHICDVTNLVLVCSLPLWAHGDGEVDETDFIAAVAERSELRTHNKWLTLVSTAPQKTQAELNSTFKTAVTKVALGISMSGGMVHSTNRIGKTVLPKEPTDPNAATDNQVAHIATCLQMGIGKLQEDLEHLPADGKGYSGHHELLANDQPQSWVRGLELPPFSVIEYAADVF